MFRSSRILGVDIGASSVKIGEFSVTSAGGLQLSNYHWGELGVDSGQEDNRGPAIISTIQQLLKERKIRPGPAVISVSGQSVFTRFVKLPVVEEKKVLQIVKYEAAQNVPFPIEEVVWDYQLIGTPESKELEVVLVAIKSDIIEELARYVEKAGLKTQLVDVATMALYNSVRYNYGEMDGCTLLVDIGSRTSNLIFIEKSKIFSRNMPIAGNTITQAIASELQVSPAQADELKRKIGFVGLGGAYEEPSSEQAAKVSKIIRNVMTRLHANISQTVNFYRTQHGGSPPVRLLLSGGTCIIPYTDQFFREKLNIEVSYFNPFKSVDLGPNVRREDLSKCAHFFGEVIGLGLRQMSECPIEVNLIPKSVAFRKGMEKKYPYFAGTAACIVLGLLCWVVYAKKVADVLASQLQPLEQQVQKFDAFDRQVQREFKKFSEVNAKVAQLQWVVDGRGDWIHVLNSLSASMPEDMWLTLFSPRSPIGGGETRRAPQTGSRFGTGDDEGMMPGMGRGGRGGPAMPQPEAQAETKQESKPQVAKVDSIDLEGQGVNDITSEGAKYKMVKDFVLRLRESGLFSIPEGQEEEVIKRVEPMSGNPALFQFRVEVKLAKPIQVRP
jgi:type IV pilus assembly protein PilM